jgi:hypothetical protein
MQPFLGLKVRLRTASAISHFGKVTTVSIVYSQRFDGWNPSTASISRGGYCYNAIAIIHFVSDDVLRLLACGSIPLSALPTIGVLVSIVIEVIPDAPFCYARDRHSKFFFPASQAHPSAVSEAMIVDNPSAEEILKNLGEPLLSTTWNFSNARWNVTTARWV